jgi:hypothetical protein
MTMHNVWTVSEVDDYRKFGRNTLFCGFGLLDRQLIQWRSAKSELTVKRKSCAASRSERHFFDRNDICLLVWCIPLFQIACILICGYSETSKMTDHSKQLINNHEIRRT